MNTKEKEKIKAMSAKEMVEYISALEECEVLCNPYHSNPRGFDLYFVPKSFAISMVMQIEQMVTWASAHRYIILMHYDTFKKAIVAKFNRLDPESQYQEEEIIR